jgi:hypothetical protein
MTESPRGPARVRGGPHRAAGTGRSGQTVRHAVADDPGGQRKRPAESLEVKTVALFLQVKVKTAVALLLLEVFWFSVNWKKRAGALRSGRVGFVV